MNGLECRRIADLLPERARGALDGATTAWVDAHLASCPECRRELSLVKSLRRAVAGPPDELASRIRSALREESPAERLPSLRTGPAARAMAPVVSVHSSESTAVQPSSTSESLPGRRARGRRWIRWSAAAAATVVLAFGTARIVEQRGGPSEAELWQSYLEEQPPPPWTEDDGLVAGAPVLEDLSALTDEDLAVVLQELGP